MSEEFRHSGCTKLATIQTPRPGSPPTAMRGVRKGLMGLTPEGSLAPRSKFTTARISGNVITASLVMKDCAPNPITDAPAGGVNER